MIVDVNFHQVPAGSCGGVLHVAQYLIRRLSHIPEDIPWFAVPLRYHTSDTLSMISLIVQTPREQLCTTSYHSYNSYVLAFIY